MSHCLQVLCPTVLIGCVQVDAPDRMNKFLATESDMSAKRNALLMLFRSDEELAVKWLSGERVLFSGICCAKWLSGGLGLLYNGTSCTIVHRLRDLNDT